MFWVTVRYNATNEWGRSYDHPKEDFWYLNNLTFSLVIQEGRLVAEDEPRSVNENVSEYCSSWSCEGVKARLRTWTSVWNVFIISPFLCSSGRLVCGYGEKQKYLRETFQHFYFLTVRGKGTYNLGGKQSVSWCLSNCVYTEMTGWPTGSCYFSSCVKCLGERLRVSTGVWITGCEQGWLTGWRERVYATLLVPLVISEEGVQCLKHS